MINYSLCDNLFNVIFMSDDKRVYSIFNGSRLLNVEPYLSITHYD